MKQKIELDYGNSCGVPTIDFMPGLYENDDDGWFLRFDWDTFDLTIFFSDETWLRELRDKIDEALQSSTGSANEVKK